MRRRASGPSRCWSAVSSRPSAILIPRDAESGVVLRAGIAGVVAWFVVGAVAPWLIERLPGARSWGCFVYMAAMITVPAAAVILWALYGF